MTELPDDLALAARSGLPDALKVLLRERPREGWREDPHFDGLVSFWLERHLMFRSLMEAMRAETAQLLDAPGTAPDPRVWAGRLSRRGSMFVNELHGHHMIEDRHYFPQLSVMEPKLARGFEILDRDHHALDEWLARFAEAANGAITAASTGAEAPALRDAAARFAAEAERLDRLLDRHLEDEEDLVAPVILRHGFQG